MIVSKSVKRPLSPMPRRTFLTTACLGIAASFSGCNRSGSVESKSTNNAIEALTKAVRTNKEHKVDRYLRAAIELQALGKDLACDVLLAFTKEYGDLKRLAEGKPVTLGYEIAVLCRMLFTNRSGSEFERPSLGGARFPGGTEYTDWPLEPIEIVDGVPFFISHSYIIAGRAFSPLIYIGYCMGNCDWSSYKFEMKSDAQKEEALKKLLVSPKWKQTLTPSDKDFFSAQIR